MTWFVFSLISVFALAAAELIQQRLLGDDNDVDPKTSTVLTFGIQTVLVIPVIFIIGQGNNFFAVFDKRVFWFLLLSSVSASFAMYYYLKSFLVKNLSFSTTLISFSVVVSSILGILVFKESVNLEKFIGIFLVLASIVIINYSNEHFERNSLFGLLAGIFFGITYTFDKMVVLEVHPMVYLFWSFLFVILIAFYINPRPVINAIKTLRAVDIRNLMISGTGYLIFNVCTFFAYSVGGEVGRVDAINNSQIFLIIIAEYFILKQRVGTIRKFSTAAIAFLGVYILGNF